MQVEFANQFSLAGGSLVLIGHLSQIFPELLHLLPFPLLWEPWLLPQSPASSRDPAERMVDKVSGTFNQL